jgi:phosphonate transport system substrate-binding protein
MPRCLTILLTAALLAGGIGFASADAQPPQRLIITAIPDDGDADRMRENFGALAAGTMGRAVESPPSTCTWRTTPPA